MSGNILKINNLSASYGQIKALENINLEIKPREIVALLGPNGAGKSTILKVIFGLVSKTSGEMIFAGKKIEPQPWEMVRRGLSYVPQGIKVFSEMTVEENLLINSFVYAKKYLLQIEIEKIYEIFPVLKQKKAHKARELSGGEQQMLALSRSLMTKPKVILLDEPTLGLSPMMIKLIFSKIKEINQTGGTAVLIVEHNIRSVLEISDSAYILRNGQIINHKKADDLLKSDLYKNIFNG